jgi:hypothetical protein
MQGNRVSKRQAAARVEEELHAKKLTRAAEPSQKLLDNLQPPPQRKSWRTKAKTKAKKASNGSLREATPCPVPRPIEETPFIPGPLPASSPPTQSSLPDNSPAPPSRQQFDPTLTQINHKQHISLVLIWFIDGKKKETILKTQDINDILRSDADWVDIQKLVTKEVDFGQTIEG